MTTATEYTVRLRRPHAAQLPFVTSEKPRIIIRAGRRGGKTTGVAIKAVQQFLIGARVLYAVPTQEQVDAFWFEVKRALAEPLDAGVYYKNESLHLIELAGTKQRIRAKTAWNADMLRGDSASLLIIDEWQLCNEDMWDRVGAPMLIDVNGSAIFIYTPPSLAARTVSKARDPRHAAKMYAAAKTDATGRWEAFHWTSRDNPYVSADAIDTLVQDITPLSYRQEILAEDVDEAPGALWKRDWIESNRTEKAPELVRIVVAIDPASTSSEQSDETGITVAGISQQGHGYVLADSSGRYSPDGWARTAINLLRRYNGDRIIGEDNNGGEMVESTIRTVDPAAPVKRVHASRGKAARAEPIAALYQQGKVHHVGVFPLLEDQLTTWEPMSGHRSPDRLDSLVWAMSELALGNQFMVFV